MQPFYPEYEANRLREINLRVRRFYISCFLIGAFIACVFR